MPAAYTARVLAMQRTHRRKADTDWLPPGVRRKSLLVSGAMWTGAGAAVAGAVVAVPVALLLWKGLVLGGAGIALAGERARHAIIRRQLRRMTHGELDLADVSARGEGELVVVRGTIEADELLRGIVREVDGVFRRMELTARGRWVHEAAVDFALIDGDGHRILIEAAGARWMTPPRELVRYPAARFHGEQIPVELRKLTEGQHWVHAAERVLPAGAAVQIVGYKTATADATGDFVDYRRPPQRATLRSGPNLPLLITMLDELT